MNMRWNEYTPRDKRYVVDGFTLRPLQQEHKEIFQERLRNGLEKSERKKTEDSEPLYMVARAKDLLTTSPRKDGFLVDAGAYMGFEDSWLTYEGKEPVNHRAKVQ